MQASLTTSVRRQEPGTLIGLTLLIGIFVFLWTPEAKTLWHIWGSDPSLSHGPLIVLISLGLLWLRKQEFGAWNAATTGGLVALALSSLVYVGSIWADIDFLKPMSLVLMIACCVWFLGGIRNLKIAAGALAFNIFMIPWPTTLVDRISFPLQLASSSYAALFAGIVGIPVVRDGVHLAVQSNPDVAPIYSIVVAQACSGLTSLTVLLALAYIIAYYTPVRFYWRMLLVAVVVPLTLFNNALRLTIILIVGAHHRPALAQWIHDHESPVLLFLCSLGLLTVRHFIVNWTGNGASGNEKHVEQVPISDH